MQYRLYGDTESCSYAEWEQRDKVRCAKQPFAIRRRSHSHRRRRKLGNSVSEMLFEKRVGKKGTPQANVSLVSARCRPTWTRRKEIKKSFADQPCSEGGPEKVVPMCPLHRVASWNQVRPVALFGLRESTSAKCRERRERATHLQSHRGSFDEGPLDFGNSMLDLRGIVSGHALHQKEIENDAP